MTNNIDKEDVLDIEFFDRFKTEEEKEKMINLFDMFRTEVHDADAELNILNGGEIENTNAKILKYFQRAIRDLNSGTPITKYEIKNFPDEGLLVDGAVIFYLIANGILQMRNQLDYNDGGLAIGMFNKTGQYQSWAQFLLQSYHQNKAAFKQGELSRSLNAGFMGIGSEFGYFTGWGEY